MAQTFNYPLNLASSVASTVSSIFIPTNATIGNVLYNTLTVGNMLSNNLNLGSVSMFSGSFSASNNQVSAANVTGLIFSNSNVNYFEIILTVGITTSIPSTINAVYTIRGNYNASGWALAVSYIGDTTGVTFSINSVTGQISYTSTNISFWTSDIFRYRVEQITSTGTYTSLIAGATTSNYSFSTLQILSTTDALPNNNIGALQVAGGVTIAKELFIGGTSFFNTAGSLGINTTNISYNLDVSGTARFTTSVTTAILSATSSTITNIVGTAISAANIIGSTNISSAALFSLNQTTTNIVGTAISAANIIGSTNISSAALYSTNITTTNLVANFTSLGNLTSSTGTFANKVGGSQTVGTIVVTTSASLIGNTNTIGNLYTTGGNVGVGTVTPGFTLDVNGSTRITNTNASSMGTLIVAGPSTNSSYTPANTTSGQLMSVYGAGGGSGYSNIDLSTFLTSSSFNYLPTARISMFDLGVGNCTFNILTKNTIALGSMVSRIFIDGSGNVGINTTSPATTLDVNGNIRINFSNPTTSNRITANPTDNFIYTSNTVGHYSLMWAIDQTFSGSFTGQMSYLSGFYGQKFFTGGVPRMMIDINGNIGINTTAPAFTLDVNGIIRNSGGNIVTAMNLSDISCGQTTSLITAMSSQLFSASSAGVSTGVVTPFISTNSFDFGCLYKNPAAQFDFWRTYINLVTGTYTFRLDFAYAADRGIATIVLNGSSVGTIDTYNSTNGRFIGTITGITVANSGNFKVELQINSKNASSTNYYFIWNTASFIRTA